MELVVALKQIDTPKEVSYIKIEVEASGKQTPK